MELNITKKVIKIYINITESDQNTIPGCLQNPSHLFFKQKKNENTSCGPPIGAGVSVCSRLSTGHGLPDIFERGSSSQSVHLLNSRVYVTRGLNAHSISPSKDRSRDALQILDKLHSKIPRKKLVLD